MTAEDEEAREVRPQGAENHLRSLLVAMAAGSIIVLAMGWDADVPTKAGMIAVWCCVAVVSNLAKRIDPGTTPRGGGGGRS